MTISDHLENFGGKKVVDWESGSTVDPAKNAIRLRLDYDEGEEDGAWARLFDDFLNSPGAANTTALVVGDWGQTATGTDSSVAIHAIVDNRAKLPALTALFLGDMVMEESEISWITQSEVGPLLAAFPNLREFGVRGGNALSITCKRHAALQKLVVETGGLDAGVVRQILAADFPQLTHLELWLGTDNYGATTSVEDLQPLLTGNLFPKLRYLGLKNSEIADEIAVALAESPILRRIETLDISMGTLSDEGAQALADAPAIENLKHLDIHHHYVSDELVAILEVKCESLDASDQQDDSEDENDRYVAVSE